MLLVMLQILLRIACNGFGQLIKVVITVRTLFVFMFIEREIISRDVDYVSENAVPLSKTVRPKSSLSKNGFSRLWKVSYNGASEFLIVVCLAVSLFTIPFNAQAVPAGTVITNTATANFVFAGSPGNTTSNPVTITTTSLIPPTISTLTLYQFDSTASSSFTPTVVTQNATSGPPGAGFFLSPAPVLPIVGGGSTILTATDPQPLNIAELFSTGEPVFVRVDDGDQNVDPLTLDTVRVVVTSSAGDEEELILTETGVNTGVFAGYVQSTQNPVSPYDGVISLGPDTSVSAAYTDPLDSSDTSIDTTLADPFGVVFSSFDGVLLDGASVTIVDSSGNPASVFGDDGVSVYPSSVITGSSATDSGGTIYTFPPGGYRFPRLAPGDYRLVITAPSDYKGPSIKTKAELDAQFVNTFTLDNNASYGLGFTLLPGLPLHVDIPLDVADSTLTVSKTVSKDSAAIGDFVQYTIEIKNIDTAAANGINVFDTLPVGLRYQDGSTRIAGVASANPVISNDGRGLQFSVPTVVAGETVQVSYITELTAGTKLGKVVNSVFATDDTTAQSNTALASLIVTDDLFSNRSFLAGRVIIGECDDGVLNDQLSKRLSNPGQQAVRVFMEDGTYTATDENGRFHFEGVKPGSHVVQIDKESIPDNLELVQCINNTRFSGTAYSQFVDIQGGSLWRTDFYLREKQAVSGKATSGKTTLIIQSELVEEYIKYTIEISNGEVSVKNYRLVINLPEGTEYEAGSSAVNSAVIDDPYVNESVLVYRFGDLGSNWKKELVFNSRVKEKSTADKITTVFVTVDTETKKNIRSSPIKNRLGTTGVPASLSTQNRREELAASINDIAVPEIEDVKLVTSESGVSEISLEARPKLNANILVKTPALIEQHDISAFDELWIKNQKPGYKWLMPDVNYSPLAPSVNIAIQHKPSDSYEMKLNGERLNPLFFFGTIKNKNASVARSYWQGVHLKNGDNYFEFIVKNKAGKVIKTLAKNVIYSSAPVRAELAKEFSYLIADGRTVPVAAIRVFDKEGNFARPGSRGDFALSQPFMAKQEVEALQVNRLSGLNREKPQYIVGQNGIALIELEPTTQTGKLQIALPFPGRKTSRLHAWMEVEVRDWILVGLAEGSVGYNTVSGNKEELKDGDIEDDFYTDGKIAFYAKGRIKGDWLLTAAYDTSKKKVTGEERVNQLIDPNTYYTIYGDNSNQRYDASSNEKLFVKIERHQFYALFGDMDTGLSMTELSKFSRRMTGLKSEFDNGKYSYTAFAAENVNNFIKDEIQGEGISGLYHLRGKNIVINSDEIVIETRDRFRSEIILKTETLRRYLDYSIDYSDGTVFFRQPILSRDESFNPIFIVAVYEVESAVEGDITAGGRVAVKLNNDTVELGATLVHDGSDQNKGDLIGVDARIAVNDKTEARLEIATSDVESAGEDLSGSAYSAELIYGGDDIKARAYAKQEDEEFGLGQQSVSQTGTRKYGVDANYHVSKNITVDAKLYHEDNLSTDSSRNVVEANSIYSQRDYSLSAGARIVRDEDAVGNSNDSNLLLLGGSRKFLDGALRVRGNAEIAINSADESADYPSRYILGTDYFVTPTINLFAENEWTLGEDQDTQMTRAGVRSTPWTNAQINTAINQETNENGMRSFSTLGLTQAFPISERWSGDFTYDHSKTIREPGATPFNENVPIAQGTASINGGDNDFTAVSVGTTYKASTYTINNRIEKRNASQESKTGVLVNWERNLQEGVAYSATAKLFKTERDNNSERLDSDIRLSMAYRPLKSRWIALSRLDFKLDSNTDILGIKTRQRKLIENLTANYLLDNRNQLAFNVGLKYVVDSFDGDEYNGLTHLLGAEYRHDLSEIFDVGAHAHMYTSSNSGTTQYSTGISAGWNMTRNIWLSAGYNFEGFSDSDFSAAGHTVAGPYIRFRMKFDQDTLDDIKGWMK